MTGARPDCGGLAFKHKRIQRLRRLIQRRTARDAERVFVVEGAKVLAEALDAGASVESLYLAPGASDPRPGASGTVIERALETGIRAFDLEPGVIERVSGTVTPQPLLAVANYVDVGLDDLRAGAPARGGFERGPVVVCVDVRDPGNLGTVLRSAEAAGAAGVICCEGTVDVYNPKSVRASAGSLFHVQVVSGGDPVEVLATLGGWGLQRMATRPSGGMPYFRADLTRPCAIILGNEASGLPAEVEGLVDEVVSIPMAGRGNSLNVGMAAAVLCFEAARQRFP